MIDSQPRIISNLIVDQTVRNPAAVAVAADRRCRARPARHAADPEHHARLRPVGAVQPDVHVLRPVLRSRPRPRDQGRRHRAHAAAAGRSAVRAGQPDELHGDDPRHQPAGPRRRSSAPPTTSRSRSNTTTPWVDQNQTYTSHPSHQVFLREYAMDARAGRRRPARCSTATTARRVRPASPATTSATSATGARSRRQARDDARHPRSSTPTCSTCR